MSLPTRWRFTSGGEFPVIMPAFGIRYVLMSEAKALVQGPAEDIEFVDEAGSEFHSSGQSSSSGNEKSADEKSANDKSTGDRPTCCTKIASTKCYARCDLISSGSAIHTLALCVVSHVEAMQGVICMVCMIR